MSEVFATGLGADFGRRARGWYFARKIRRIHAGHNVSLRCHAHRSGRPAWRLSRGSVVRSRGRLKWRPLLWRWQNVALGDVVALAVTPVSGGARADRMSISIATRHTSSRRHSAPLLIDQLITTADRGPLFERLLPGAALRRSDRLLPVRGG